MTVSVWLLAAGFAPLPLLTTAGAEGVLGSAAGVPLAADGAPRAATDQLPALQALNVYMAQLREYRALQGELEPWTVAFAAENGRKATIRDVEAAGQSCLAGQKR